MQIINLAPVVVDNVGVEILTSAQAKAATTAGLEAVGINPSIDIVLVDDTLSNNPYGIPGAIPGSVANSPWVCPANTVTVVKHRSGPIRAISTGANSTVKTSLGCAP